MNIEIAAQALAGNGWGSLRESVRDMHRADATAAINAYRTLTADQWDQFADIIEHFPDAEDAMTALGFRRAEEQP